MTKKEFKNKYREHGITAAFQSLLESQKDNAIRIPVSLHEFLKSGESTEVSFKDDNNHECYIVEIRLEDGNVQIKVYDYYRSEFYDVDPYRLIYPKDAMDFALEYGCFDKGPAINSASEFSNEQLDLLDEFVAAAKKLNDAGVSLFWNDDDNALAVVNRDAMQDCDFFEQENEVIASNPEAKSVYDCLSNGLDVTVNYINKKQDYLFFPKSDE